MANDSNGLTPGRRPEAGPDPNLGPDAARTAPVRSSGVRSPGIDRRRILWRDSATILVIVVLALLGSEALLPRGGATPTDTPIPSSITVGSLPPGFSLPPGVTFGPIIDPSLGIDATPTPIPVITGGPPATAGPSPSSTPKPSKTPPPSGQPSVGPSEPPPAPIAGFNWSPNPAPFDQPVSFTDTSSGATTWAWDFGDGGTSSEQNPIHTYTEALPCAPLPLSCTVTLVVTGPGGSDSKTHPVDLYVPAAT